MDAKDARVAEDKLNRNRRRGRNGFITRVIHFPMIA